MFIVTCFFIIIIIFCTWSWFFCWLHKEIYWMIIGNFFIVTKQILPLYFSLFLQPLFALYNFCQVSISYSSLLSSFISRNSMRIKFAKNELVTFLFHFWAMFPYYTLCKLQKTKGYLMFSGDVKLEHLAILP